ncbi:hypothetical protein IRJ41_000349 [Triplophysa rosa]|uniref:Uncharacterized protein n=1 Tax=Triplophysa rosa TaxID=992332 RepID=A0A9W8C9Q0_TRIRA|nr:hypothetical protein IRJ41_000349 [Triplophysa rosa]
MPERHSPGQAERAGGDDQVSEKDRGRKRMPERHSPGQAERAGGDDQVSEKDRGRKRMPERHSPGQAERAGGDDQVSEKDRGRKRMQERHSPGQAERAGGDDQNLGATDESESDSDDGSEYVPTPTSSDSEDCSLGEGPDFPKDTEIQVKKINTTLTQKVDEVESDSSDLELPTDEVDDVNEEGMSKITVKWCQKGEKRKWDKKHYCIYCKKPQSKIARHLERKHNQEEDVARAICFPKKSKKRRLLLDQLRYKELSRSVKHRADPDKPNDSDQDSDGPGTHTKTTVKRSSKIKKNGSAMQKKTERRPWSDGEKKAVWRQLGNYITLAKVPGKEKCLECIEAESALEKRHWMDIKNQVHNTIQSRKKKMLS